MIGARAVWKDLDHLDQPGAGVRRVNALHLYLWSWAIRESMQQERGSAVGRGGGQCGTVGMVCPW